MVEYARRVQGGSDLEDQLQRFQHPLKRWVLDSSNLLVVSDRNIHIVLKYLEISIRSLTKVKLLNVFEKRIFPKRWPASQDW